MRKRYYNYELEECIIVKAENEIEKKMTTNRKTESYPR